MGAISIIIAILIFSIIIAIHEFGHFAVAKLCGVKVNEFAIGMGPAIFSRQKSRISIGKLKNDPSRSETIPRGMMMKVTPGIATRFPNIPQRLSLLKTAIEIGNVERVATMVLINEAMIYAPMFQIIPEFLDLMKVILL